MLKNTFLHIPGIGIKTERRFWDSGIYKWDDFTKVCPIRLSQSKIDGYFIQYENQGNTVL